MKRQNRIFHKSQTITIICSVMWDALYVSINAGAMALTFAASKAND
ncbi:MAG: hypothetical protein FWF53_01895 [Candidatus Azobacteroides sp.]|nr:hypothetical protein [Candidatus Azobacteroides sp.]